MTRSADTEQPFLPRYQISSLLGEGAMATVHRVRDTRDGSTRALKALKPERADDPQAVSRFVQEYLILRRLHHPSVPAVVDMGRSSSGQKFIVMELIDGVPLDRYMQAHSDDLWTIIHGTLEALSFVHEHDLLHLDLKPSNVLVRTLPLPDGSERPVPALIDFGFAHRRAGEQSVRLTGTAEYMSPEMIQGGNLSRATDYYSLGIVLYELIEGTVPFTGTIPKVLQAHLDTPVRFKSSRMEFAELYPAIEKLLSKVPSPRLEHFERLRQLAADRVFAPDDIMQRVYAMAYVDSLGPIGKGRVLDAAFDWVDDARQRVAGTPRRRASDKPVAADALDADLTEQVRERRDRDARTRHIRSHLFLSGPPASGRRVTLDEIHAHLLAEGAIVYTLADLVSFAEGDTPAHPRDIWASISARRQEPTFIITGDPGAASDHERDIIEYVVQRVETSRDEGDFVPVLTISTSGRPDGWKMFRDVAPDASRCVSLPTTPVDAEDVGRALAVLRGKMDGRAIDELARILAPTATPSGRTLARLRRMVNANTLRYEKGRWSLRETGTVEDADIGDASYHVELVAGFSETTREVVSWLAVHPGSFDVRELEALGGFTESDVAAAIRETATHRLIDDSSEGSERRVAMASSSVRGELYANMDAADRQRKHEAVHHLLAGVEEPSLERLEALSYHLEMLGDARGAMLATVRGVRRARDTANENALRRFCARGFELLAADNVQKGALYRFFVKQLAYLWFSRTSYGELIRVLEHHYGSDDVPLSLAYRYAVALERTGRREGAHAIIDAAFDGRNDHALETQEMLTLAKAGCLLGEGRFQEAIECLAETKGEVLTDYDSVFRDVLYMFTAQAVGDVKKYGEYLERAKARSEEHDFAELRLRVYYSVTFEHLQGGLYEAALKEFREAIAYAKRHRADRGLMMMYMQASAAYHAIGLFDRARVSLDRGMEIGRDLFSPAELDRQLIKYSRLLDKVGRYGDALRYAEIAIERGRKRGETALEFAATVRRLEILSDITRHGALTVLDDVPAAQRDLPRSRSAAWYFHVVMLEQGRHGHYAAAEDALRRVEKILLEERESDELVAARLEWVRILIRKGDVAEAEALLDELKGEVELMQSNEIEGYYVAGRLAALRVGARADATRLIADAERIRQASTNDRLLRTLDSVLLHVYADLARREDVERVFRDFYDRLKKVCANLPDENYVREFLSRSDISGVISRYKETASGD